MWLYNVLLLRVSQTAFQNPSEGCGLELQCLTSFTVDKPKIRPYIQSKGQYLIMANYGDNYRMIGYPQEV